MMLLLLISLVLLIMLILYGRWILHGRHAIRDMDQIQKVTYYLLLIGSILLGFIVIIAFLLLFILTIDTLTNDPEAVGYVIIFYTIPFFLIATTSASIVHILLMTLRPAHYINKQKNNSIMYMIVGVVSLIAIPIYSYFIKIGIEMMFIYLRISSEFTSKLELSIFHPTKLIYAIFLTGSLLLLIGGILNFFENRKQQTAFVDERKNE